MRKRVYEIRGFDCASCASKVEAHLSKRPEVTSVRIDFLGERLYVNYVDEEWEIEEILSIIHEVEDDPVEISEVGEKKEKKFDKETLWLLLRIGYCLTVFLLCGFLFKDLYWVRFGLYLSALLVIEYDIIEKVVMTIVRRKNPLDEYLLIFLASTGAFVLACLKYQEQGHAVAFGNEVFMMEEHFEAVLVCLLWQVGELFQSLAVKASRKAIVRAVDSRVEEALLLTAEGPKRVEAKTLREGDNVLVSLGGLIPIDGEVYEGSGYVDASSLTGESMPVEIHEGSPVYAGTLLTQGELKIKASKDYSASASAKVLDLVTSSLEKKGDAEKFITKFARWYTPAIFLFAIVYLVIAGLVGPSWRSAVYTGLEIMVISCPCAIVISVPLAYFAAVGLASKRGVIVKGASYLDVLNRVDEICLDKTGTLTKGSFVIKEKNIDSAVKEAEFDKVLRALESRSSHPLARAVIAGLGQGEQAELSDYENVFGQGVSASLNGGKIYAGNAKMLASHGLNGTTENEGVYIYLFDGKKVWGYVHLVDETKEDSATFIQELKAKSIQPTLLSGDKQVNVSAFASSLGIDSYAYELLPEDKLRLLEEKQSKGHHVAFLGDGVNDAPCLARADVGVAMGGLGADMAVEEADVLLLHDNPRHFLSALSVAKHCRNVIIFNIAFALLVKLTVLVLAMVYHEAMPMEVAVLSDTGISVLLTVNSLLLLCRRK